MKRQIPLTAIIFALTARAALAAVTQGPTDQKDQRTPHFNDSHPVITTSPGSLPPVNLEDYKKSSAQPDAKTPDVCISSGQDDHTLQDFLMIKMNSGAGKEFKAAVDQAKSDANYNTHASGYDVSTDFSRIWNSFYKRDLPPCPIDQIGTYNHYYRLLEPTN